MRLKNPRTCTTESAASFIKRKEMVFLHDSKLIKMKDIGRKGKFYFRRQAWTFLPQSNLDEKVFIFERLEKVKYTGKLAYGETWKRGELEYRIGYFIVGRNGRTKGKWVWGQFCSLIPADDLSKLLEKARAKKVLLD